MTIYLKTGVPLTHFPMLLNLETIFAVDLVNVQTLCKFSDS